MVTATLKSTMTATSTPSTRSFIQFASEHIGLSPDRRVVDDVRMLLLVCACVRLCVCVCVCACVCMRTDR